MSPPGSSTVLLVTLTLRSLTHFEDFLCVVRQRSDFTEGFISGLSILFTDYAVIPGIHGPCGSADAQGPEGPSGSAGYASTVCLWLGESAAIGRGLDRCHSPAARVGSPALLFRDCCWCSRSLNSHIRLNTSLSNSAKERGSHRVTVNLQVIGGYCPGSSCTSADPRRWNIFPLVYVGASFLSVAL